MVRALHVDHRSKAARCAGAAVGEARLRHHRHARNTEGQAMIAALLLSAQLIAPPAAVRADLDTICKGWQLAPVTPEIAAEIKTRTPTWPPNLLPGDFNGDKQIDVAVLIECNGSAQLVAFLSGTSGFSRQVLEKPQPYDA